MSVGGKKDAEYLANLLEDVIVPYDPDKTKSTIFRFDGAGNVSSGKVPKILLTPRWIACCFSFFSDIAKIKVIKVTCSSCNAFHFSNYLFDNAGSCPKNLPYL